MDKVDLRNILSFFTGTLGFATSTAITANDVLSLVLTILSILSITLSIVTSFVTWLDKAKEDGKITGEELNELSRVVEDAVENIKKGTKKDD